MSQQRGSSPIVDADPSDLLHSSSRTAAVLPNTVPPQHGKPPPRRGRLRRGLSHPPHHDRNTTPHNLPPPRPARVAATPPATTAAAALSASNATSSAAAVAPSASTAAVAQCGEVASAVADKRPEDFCLAATSTPAGSKGKESDRPGCGERLRARVIYDEAAMDGASERGEAEVLQWWKDSGYELKFTQKAVLGAVRGHCNESLQWWKGSGIIPPGIAVLSPRHFLAPAAYHPRLPPTFIALPTTRATQLRPATHFGGA
ncbi:hypothetical protein DFJ73DRAFT_779800 [Zopfochytrium polystomum]|nr:hypothetical protein DFJ73DRAFT_786935 [Zopfochytrium polystomum]KAI9337734.1 hypothetical protein DFJ73DRAFT_779800 [Zopfochytrium polystomum]